MITGQLVLNGLTDDDIIKLLELKKQNQKLAFNPTTLRQPQPAPQRAGQPTQRPAGQTYDGATFPWTTPEGLTLVKEVLRLLTEPQP